MIAYTYNQETKQLSGTVKCQLNPVATKREGHNVYILPANSTTVEPLEPQDGFYIVWNGVSWNYEPIPVEPEPEPYEPTKLEKLQIELSQTEYKLRKIDYIGVKIATGRATVDEYSDKIALMSELAEKINDLRGQIAELSE